MASAFNTSVPYLEDELTQLILDGQISARIDSHAKVTFLVTLCVRNVKFLLVSCTMYWHYLIYIVHSYCNLRSFPLIYIVHSYILLSEKPSSSPGIHSCSNTIIQITLQIMYARNVDHRSAVFQKVLEVGEAYQLRTKVLCACDII